MNTFGFPSHITGIKEIPFNKNNPYKIFVDINSCFATVEQQFNPSLRGKPIAITPYKGPTGCLIAPSIEAKEYGIKTGMRVKEGLKLYPKLILLEPDPPKYRLIHNKIKEILREYTPKVTPKSIDEFVIDIEKTPAQKKGSIKTAQKIKDQIKKRVGEWITVSIGISTNTFLAKTASDLEKPNGLQIIDYKNHTDIFANLGLTELKGIKSGNASRLATQNIFTTMDMYNAGIEKLCNAFNSIAGYYWHLRIRGHEIDIKKQTQKKSIGNSYAIPGSLKKTTNLEPILYKLVEKTCARMRKEDLRAKGFQINLSFWDGTHYKAHKTLTKSLNGTQEIYKILLKLLKKNKAKKPVRIIAETCFHLENSKQIQLELFEDTEEKEELYKTIDKINNKFGKLTIKPAELLRAEDAVPDSIGFGKG